MAIVRTFAVLSVVWMVFGVSDSKANERWNWNEQRSNVTYYMFRAPENYEIQLVRKPMSRWQELEIRVRDGDKVVSFKGHEESNFIISDGILVYSEHSSYASGCKLVAMDLKSGKKLWENNLKGLGPISHSKYRNQINMLVGGGKVHVHAKESGGAYIEKVEIKTGKTVFHQLGRGDK